MRGRAGDKVSARAPDTVESPRGGGGTGSKGGEGCRGGRQDKREPLGPQTEVCARVGRTRDGEAPSAKGSTSRGRVIWSCLHVLESIFSKSH